jgi:sugar phosphate isomerase/epimerase
LLYGIQRAAELGYDGVEINLRDPAKVDLDEIISAAQTHKVEILSILD